MPCVFTRGLSLSLPPSRGEMVCRMKLCAPLRQTCFTSDSAHILSNGQVYVYTGLDEDRTIFFRISSNDIVNWHDADFSLSIENFSWIYDCAWGSSVHRGRRLVLLVRLLPHQAQRRHVEG